MLLFFINPHTDQYKRLASREEQVSGFRGQKEVLEQDPEQKQPPERTAEAVIGQGKAVARSVFTALPREPTWSSLLPSETEWTDCEMGEGYCLHPGLQAS